MKRNLFLLLVFISSFFTIPSQALVKVDVNDPNYSPLPIAITDFVSLDVLGGKFSEVIAQDLKKSGVFINIDKNAFRQKITDPDAIPRFDNWSSLGSKLLVVGRVIKEGSNRLRVDFRLWDLAVHKQILGKKFVAHPEDWRSVAHTISDDIHQSITGDKGYFNTRILFVSENIVSGMIKRRLCLMDQDSSNMRYLTPDSGKIIFSPRFSPNQQKIAYVSYDGDDLPKIYLMDIRTDREPKRIGNFRGIIFSPSFSPNGSSIVMSVQNEEAIDIYVVNLYSNSVSRLTNTLSNNISPSYSPNSSQIVFASDRGGDQQLYIMKSDGSGQRRISHDKEASYFDPSWSPRGDLIAFTKYYEGKFSIGVMKSDGSKERILVTDYNLQTPSWSPNGRYVMFSRKNINDVDSKLYLIDINGKNESLINTPAYASDPHWVPFIN
ncbi:MAG: Tol-Pal system protein TolB [Candidatus Liberibacter europaeus]|nr:Tol-Pal system protein TolB [Candidatus Liberibacter europaeus]